jgi:DNA-directed RNA polymerase subunit beta'
LVATIFQQPAQRRKRERNINDIVAIRIGLASPDKIRSWSYGEVKKPETINYRTFKPERDGLFCARIFGPVSDYECLCGRYRKLKYKGVVCEKCGVEVTEKRVRRERMGHIELAAPVAHIWYVRNVPSRMGLLLGLTARELERVIYYESYIVIDPGDTDLQFCQLLTQEEYRDLRKQYGHRFVAKMGAEGIREVLRKIDLAALAQEFREEMKTSPSRQRKIRAAKRLRVVEAFLRSGQKPEWMILDVIPVLPPELRPLVPLEGGRFATSDLNDLYRRVINRNNRLKKLLELRAPEVIIRNEKRMLQEAVDALLDNGRRSRVMKGAQRRPLKSLSDNLKGKHGRFRQNLLGKRVDFSGRAVIVVGPELKLWQCALPKKMALELFKPFVYHQLEKMGVTDLVRRAKELVAREDPQVWDALEQVVRDHPVLLNRAPTLHRLSIQAFQPILIDEKAIRIHPLVCTAYNADFDGDQMGVHVPISPEAQLEASTLMLSVNNILSPANGKPLASPTQDMVLGIYYLTVRKPMPHGTTPESVPYFGTADEVLMAYQLGYVQTHTPIKFRFSGLLIDTESQNNTQDIVYASKEEVTNRWIDTTVGRVLFHAALPPHMPFVNGVLKKKGVASLVHFVYLKYGMRKTVELLDALKDVGFRFATKAGISMGAFDDLVIPQNKWQIIEDARREVRQIEERYRRGEMNAREKYNHVVAIWSRVTEDVMKEMIREMREQAAERGELNPVYVMVDSGARGSDVQIRQLAGMRGLMAKPSGEIIETPITSNFREGLSVLEYFISTHGARKGLADTALKTADAGYLTRRLVDVAQDVYVTEYDCGTMEGIYIEPLIEDGEIVEPLRERVVGRIAAEAIRDPLTGEVIVGANEMIDEEKAFLLEEAGIDRVKIRSVLTCQSRRGVCVLCFGRDLATGRLVQIGTPVGIIAAQSIGEPGTQLTMRTFHYGGTAGRIGEVSQHRSRHGGIVQFRNLQTIRTREGHRIAINRKGQVVVIDLDGRERERYTVVYGARVLVENGQAVEPDTPLVEWDPYSSVILCEHEGTVRYHDIRIGETVQEEIDEVTKNRDLVVVDFAVGKTVLKPSIEIVDGAGEVIATYLLPTGARLVVQEDQKVYPGDVLAKIPRETTKTKDITGGLPRVEALFEARKPAEPAVIAEIDGIVRFVGINEKGQRILRIEGEGGVEREYTLPRGAHVIVRDGEAVEAGEPLMEGPINPTDILRVLGVRELEKYLLNEIQRVYRSQGVSIDDKYIEIIIRQMTRWFRIEDVGDTDFLYREIVDKFRFMDKNAEVAARGGKPATGTPVLLGITRAALSTDSWISAASFQETTRVLTEAAIRGSTDYLYGLKENVIVGRLIPCGTGSPYYRQVRIEKDTTIEERIVPAAYEEPTELTAPPTLSVTEETA